MATSSKVAKEISKNSHSPYQAISSPGTSQTPGACTKTLRLTENKRRYRARRKEYVSDLESRLAEAREQGVQASKEVQLAARQVALRNARLRDLLRLSGFSADEVDSWEGIACGGDGGDADVSGCGRRAQIELKAGRCAAALASCRGDETAEREWMTPSSSISDGMGPSETMDSEVSKPTDSSHSDAGDAMMRDGADLAAATHNIPTATLVTITSSEDSRVCHTEKQIMIPPCKLLTRLAENPAADITQVLVATTLGPEEDAERQQDAGALDGGGKIECRKAYDMLMQYATTEEKMDTIARTLESGCTKNGKGGCGVRSEFVLQALDGMCG